jgi:hypothetical protein
LGLTLPHDAAIFALLQRDYFIPMRYPLLDGFRGYFLVMMTVHHLSFELFFPLQLLDYTRFSTFGAAQGFVFLSGVVVAMVYGRKLITGSEAVMRAALWQRIGLIYRYHVGLIVVILLFSLAVVYLGGQSPLALSNSQTPLLNAILSLTLLSGPPFIDILPMYLVFMAFTPAALNALHRGDVVQVAAVSLTLWLFAQTGLYGLFLDWLNGLLGLPHNGSFRIGMYFDRFAWQLVYVCGLIAGMLWAKGRLDLSRLHDPRIAKLVPVLLGLFVLFWLAKLGTEIRALPEAFRAALEVNLSHSHISLLRFANFAMMVLLAVWLIVVGPSHPNRIARAAARGLRGLMTWRPFVLLGQHSLLVYSYHVALVYAVTCLLPVPSWSNLSQQVMSLACAASLLLPVYAARWWQRHKAQP